MTLIVQRPRSVVFAAMAVCAGLMVSACVPATGDQASPERAQDDLVNLVTKTATLVDPEGWSDLGKPSWGSCSVDGGDGVRASWFYTREPLTEHTSNAQRVADYWASLGMNVRVVSEPTVSVYAEGAAAASIAFHTEPGLYSVSGTSVCVPGTSEEMIRREAGLE